MRNHKKEQSGRISKILRNVWKMYLFFLLYWRNEFTVSSLHIFICLNSSSSAPSPHTPWMLNLSSYYLFPISLSLSLPSIHLSSALERSLSLFLSKSIFSAVGGLEPYWKHFQCCWLDSSCQAEAETSCRNVDHRPDLQPPPPHSPPAGPLGEIKFRKH